MDLDNGCWPFFSSLQNFEISGMVQYFAFRIFIFRFWWHLLSFHFISSSVLDVLRLLSHLIFAKTLWEDIVFILLMKKQTKKGSVTCPRPNSLKWRKDRKPGFLDVFPTHLENSSWTTLWEDQPTISSLHSDIFAGASWLLNQTWTLSSRVEGPLKPNLTILLTLFLVTSPGLIILHSELV